MTKVLDSKRGVAVNYGVRNTGGDAGKIGGGDDGTSTYTVDIRADNLVSGIVPPVTIPKGAYIKDSEIHVEEAFHFSSSGGIGAVGTDGSETTNGLRLSQSFMSTTGVASPVHIGTFAKDTPLAANTKIGIDAGTLVPDTTAGKARLTFTVTKLSA